MVVDSTIYTFPSPLEAIDTGFKLIHATNACYQEECEGLWYDKLSQHIRRLAINMELPP